METQFCVNLLLATKGLSMEDCNDILKYARSKNPNFDENGRFIKKTPYNQTTPFTQNYRGRGRGNGRPNNMAPRSYKPIPIIKDTGNMNMSNTDSEQENENGEQSVLQIPFREETTTEKPLIQLRPKLILKKPTN
jgi:hypothetical protein